MSLGGASIVLFEVKKANFCVIIIIIIIIFSYRSCV